MVERRDDEQSRIIEAATDTFMRLLLEMLEEHEGKWVVFGEGDEEPIGGFWDSAGEALEAAYKKHGNVPLLLRQVSREFVEHGRDGKPVFIRQGR